MKKLSFNADVLKSKMAIHALCESPIEQELGSHLFDYGGGEFTIIPQYRFGPYRFDFAICDDKARPYIFIECDGKEFHSSPEEMERDIEKTKHAEEKGVPLFRMSGSVIHRAGAPIAEAAISLARAVRGQRK